MKSEGPAPLPSLLAERMEKGEDAAAVVVVVKPAVAMALHRRRCCVVACAVVALVVALVSAVVVATSLQTLRQLQEDLPQNFYRADTEVDLHGAATVVRVAAPQLISGYHGVTVTAATCTMSLANEAPLLTLQLTGPARLIAPRGGASAPEPISFTLADVDTYQTLWVMADVLQPHAGSTNDLAIVCDLDVEVMLLGAVPVRFSTSLHTQWFSPHALNYTAFTGTLTVALPALGYAFGDAHDPSATVATPDMTVVCTWASGCSVSTSAAVLSSSSFFASAQHLVAYKASPDALAGPLTCRTSPSLECGLYATATSPSNALSTLLGRQHRVVLLGRNSLAKSSRAPPAAAASGGRHLLATAGADDCVSTVCYTLAADESFAGEWCGSVDTSSGSSLVLRSVVQGYGTPYNFTQRSLFAQTTTVSYDGASAAVGLAFDFSFNSYVVLQFSARSAVVTPATAAPGDLALANTIGFSLPNVGFTLAASAPVDIRTWGAGDTGAATFAGFAVDAQGTAGASVWALRGAFNTSVSPVDSPNTTAAFLVEYLGGFQFDSGYSEAACALTGNSSLALGSAGGTTTAHFLDIDFSISSEAYREGMSF